MTVAETEVLDDNVQGAGGETEQGEQGGGENTEGRQTEGGEGADTQDEVVVTIGDEAPPTSEEDDSRAPDWVRDLRKSNREKDKRIRELEAKAAAPAPQVVTAGAKPTLEGCDFDTDRFEKELDTWKERTREAEQQEAKKRDTAEAEKKAWQGKLDAYGKAKTELKVKDFDDAEGVVLEHLSITQQGVILHGAKNPALLFYALGKNTAKAKELGSITDPVKFAFAAAELETKLKVTPRKSAPVPDKTVRGSAPVSGTVDKQLERLEAEADKTGDRSKVAAYRRQLRQKAA